MGVTKTSLSAGALLHALLLSDEEVKKRVRKIFPVVTDQAELPYILYRHTNLETQPNKGGVADSVEFEVVCCTATYSEGIELAEAVRGAVDGVVYETPEITMRSCYVTGFQSTWEANAHLQILSITARIS